MYEYGMHGWGMIFGWLIPVGLIVLFVYALNIKRNSSPKEILDRRYARGEIDTKEYRERLKELGYPKEDAAD
jgi:putative membrane protein